MILTKCCTKCHRQLPVEQFKWVKRKDAAPYREAHCIECKRAYFRARRAGGLEPRTMLRHLPPRLLAEQLCDTAFMQWRDGTPGVELRVAV